MQLPGHPVPLLERRQGPLLLDQARLRLPLFGHVVQHDQEAEPEATPVLQGG